MFFGGEGRNGGGEMDEGTNRRKGISQVSERGCRRGETETEDVRLVLDAAAV